MPSEAQLKAQREALTKLKLGFNASAAASDAAADAFNAVPPAERLKEVQAVVPAYNAVVEALRGAGQSILAGIGATDKALAAVPPPPAPAPAPTPPAPAPAPVPAPAGSMPTIHRQSNLNLAHLVHFRRWHSDSRYERFQNLLSFIPTTAGEMATIEFRKTDFTAGGVLVKLLGSTYTLLVDGVSTATTTVQPNSVTQASFVVPVGTLASGWREIDIASDAPLETCPKFFMRIKRAGDAEPDLIPVWTGSYDLAHGGSNHMWAWIERKYEPTPRPLALREYPHFSHVLPPAERFRENIVPTQGGNIRRPNVNKDGIWSGCNMQPYFWDDVIRRTPRVALLDGPRGVGNVAFANHMQLDRHGGVYACDSWRVFRTDRTGKVSTVFGRYHEGVQSHWEDTDTQQPTLKLKGNWDAVPVGKRYLHEPWGLTFEEVSLELMTTGPTQFNSITGKAELPHKTPPRLKVADSQNNRIILGTFSRDSFDAPVVVSEFITGLNDPWDIVSHGGFDYIGERGKHRIIKCRSDTGAYVSTVVERDPSNPANAFIQSHRVVRVIGTPEQIAAQPCLAPEGLFIQDGWLYWASHAQGDVRKINLTTGEFVRVGGFSKNSGAYAKIALSDGTFMERGTIFITNWSTTNFGFPQVMRPDGTGLGTMPFGRVSRGRGPYTTSLGYSGTVTVGDGHMFCTSSQEGLICISQARPGDVAYDQVQASKGAAKFSAAGYPLIHGGSGYMSHYPLPWFEDPDIDYFLEHEGHTRPPAPALVPATAG